MATAASVTPDWTTCPICLDLFDNPKSLPCIHGFCLKCLEGYFKDKSPGDEVPCPLCRKEFKIPPKGLVGLQHHFFIQHLVDARNISMKSTEVPCEACLEENEGQEGSVTTATVYCVDCNESLCEKCSRHHLRPKMKGGAHQVRPLGAELEQKLIQIRGSYCQKHKDEQVKLHCYECDENICLLCFAVKHRQHKTAEIPEVAKNLSLQINSDNQKVWSKALNVRKMTEEKEMRMNEFLIKVDRMASDIKESGKQMKKNINNQVAMELGDLELIKSEDRKKAEAVEESYQLALVAMESFHRYSQELLKKGRPSDITRAASELHKRATELLDSDVTTVQYFPPHVTFSPVDLVHLTRLNFIGQVRFDAGQPFSAAGQSLVPIDSQLNQAAETEKQLRQEITRLEVEMKQTLDNEQKIRDKLERQIKQNMQRESLFNNQLKQLQSSEKQLQQQMKDKSDQEEKLQSELKEKTQNEEKLKSQLELAQLKQKQVQQQLEKKSESEQSLNWLLKQNLDNAEKLKHQAAEMEQKQRQQIRSLEERIGYIKRNENEIREKLENQIKQEIKIKSSLSDQLKQLQSSEKQLQQQIKEKSDREEKLQSELKEKTQNEEILKSQLEPAQLKQKQLQQQLEEKSDSEQSLKSQLKQTSENAELLKIQLEQVEAKLSERVVLSSAKETVMRRQIDELSRLEQETKSKLKEETDRRLEVQEKVLSLQLERVTEGESVWGVTSLDNLLYLLRQKSSEQVEVYDMDIYSLQRCINVPGLGYKSDMIACAYNVCLYISGGDGKCVHRVTLPADNITNWSVNDEAGKLSVTDTHSVLVTCWEVRKIKEFSTDGKLLRQITLPQVVVSPWHSIQLSNGDFIVCHGGVGDLLHRVCLIGSEGQVVKSYGGLAGSGSQQMNLPSHLAIDSNGFVCVSDQNNHRVLMLSPTLTYVREVVSRDQLKWRPMRLSLDADRRRLYVADSEYKDCNWSAGRVVTVSVYSGGDELAYLKLH